jgi:hypothetical protein
MLIKSINNDVYNENYRVFVPLYLIYALLRSISLLECPNKPIKLICKVEYSKETDECRGYREASERKEKESI